MVFEDLFPYRNLMEERDDMLTKEIYPNRMHRQRLNGEFERFLLHQVKGRKKNHNIFKSLWKKIYMMIKTVVLLIVFAMALLLIGRYEP
jgi:hypothetical protein